MFLLVECLFLLSDRHNYGSCTSFYSTLLSVSSVLADDILSRHPKHIAVSNKSSIEDIYSCVHRITKINTFFNEAVKVVVKKLKFRKTTVSSHLNHEVNVTI